MKCYGAISNSALGEDDYNSLPNRVLNHVDSYIEKKHIGKQIINGMLLAIDNHRDKGKWQLKRYFNKKSCIKVLLTNLPQEDFN